MDLAHASVLLRLLARIVVYWTASIIAVSMGIAVWNFQLLDACAKTGILVNA
jgi:hypothetical protein